MVITFRGTCKSKNNAPQILAALAFASSYAHSIKTLVLQFYSSFPIDEILIGRAQVRAGLENNDEAGGI